MATRAHCAYAFDALLGHLRGHSCPPPAFAAEEEYPMFVTWSTRGASSGAHAALRGCIGTLRPTRASDIKEYALASALRDRRFAAITEDELPSLEVTVSLLTNFEPDRAWDDWVVGVHGVWIDFVHPQSGEACSATFLPDVSLEQGWSVRQAIDALVRKAGFAGVATAGLLASIKLTRYQSTLHKLTYDEYLAQASR